jgi:hypothetical protein
MCLKPSRSDQVPACDTGKQIEKVRDQSRGWHRSIGEVWFGIIERQAIHRGSFRSVRDLMIKIRQFIDGWNDRKHPFIWTKTADDILDKINRKRISTPDH